MAGVSVTQNPKTIVTLGEDLDAGWNVVVVGSGLRTKEGEGADGEGAECFYFYGHGEESEIVFRSGG